MALTPEQKALWEQKKAEIGYKPASAGPSLQDKVLQRASQIKQQQFDAEVENAPGILGGAQAIAKDAFGTIIAKPAYRASQAVASGAGALIGGEFGRKLQEVANQDANVPTPFGKIRVEGQKEFGEGGIRQVAGDVAKSASYLAPVSPATAGIGGIVKGQVLKAGAQGAAAGALGGGLTGLGEGLLDENASAGEVAMQTAGDAALGAATGGILGAVGGAAVKHAAGKEARMAEEVIDMVSPKTTPVKGAKALKGGQATIEAPGLFKEGKVSYANNPRIQKVAAAATDIIDPKKSVSQNFNFVKENIEDTAEYSVRPFLRDNKVPFNFEDLRNRLTMVTPDSGLKADPSAYTTYGRVREELLDDVARYLRLKGDVSNATDMADLWDARKIIDAKIERELGTAAFGSPQYTGVKAAARDMRSSFNKFIVDSLANPGQAEKLNVFYDFLQTARSRGIGIPNESDAIKLLREQVGIADFDDNIAKAAFYKDKIERMNLLYEALDNMAPKALAEAGKTGIELWMKDHPLVAKAVGLVAGGALAGAGFGALQEGGGKDSN